MTAIQLIDAHDHEVAALRRSHIDKIVNETTERGVIERAIERNKEIVALINEQNRALAFRAGLPYEKQDHQGEAVIVGEGIS